MRTSLHTIIGCCLCATVTGFAQADYEGGKGLITLEGPSGMFINPTSGTMPEGYGTFQACVFFPENKTDVVGWGIMSSYGLSDDLEIGVAGNYVDLRKADDSVSGIGPFARYRLTKDEGGVPQISLGAYSKFGDEQQEKVGLFAAAYKRLPIDENGPIKAVGLHLGAKQLFLNDDVNPDDTSLSGYGGVEVQLPLRMYLVGELTTKDSDLNKEAPYAYGLQWRAAGIAMSFAMIQNGGLEDASFYYGIGYAGSF